MTYFTGIVAVLSYNLFISSLYSNLHSYDICGKSVKPFTVLVLKTIMGEVNTEWLYFALILHIIENDTFVTAVIIN